MRAVTSAPCSGVVVLPGPLAEAVAAADDVGRGERYISQPSREPVPKCRCSVKRLIWMAGFWTLVTNQVTTPPGNAK